MKRQEIPEIHRLEAGEQKVLRISAAERYSMQRVAVKTGERYSISCNEDQRWVDLLIWASPRGYANALARMVGMPVPNARCFCLCGTYDEQDEAAFAIGTDHTIGHVQADAILSFFANDVRGFEWNNWGSVEVRVTRLK